MKQVPEEDSEDLTAEQIASAVATHNEKELGERLAHLSCTTCETPAVPIAHALRRRAPHLYSRTQATCAAGHTGTFVFLVDWLK